MRKGQFNLIGAIGIALGLITSAFGYGLYANNRVGAVEGRTSVLEARYEDIDKKLENMDSKIDLLLGNRRVATSTQSSFR